MTENTSKKIKYFIILFSILGISILYGCAQLSQPQMISLEDLTDFEGKQVIIQGKVI